MIVIKKFTLGYDRLQDRISLAARGAQGEVVLLWLTQRLLIRLVRALLQRLDKELEGAVAVGSLSETGTPASGAVPAAPQRNRPVQAGILPQLHALEQSAAQSVLKPERPVQPAAQAEEHLLTTIELGSNPKGHVIVCRWSAEEAAQLVMDSIQLRQFMGMLYRVFGSAEWPRTSWPDWFSADSADDTAAAPVVLH